MDCGRCGAPNPDTNHFCGNCGAALDASLDPVLQSTIDKRIDVALASKLTDQRIVEIDIQEKVIKRLTDLAKIVGIPIALLLALLSLWGIKSLSDVDSKVKQATDNAVQSMNTKVDAETERAIASLKAKVNAEDKLVVQQAQKSARASLDIAVKSATKDIEVRAKGSRKAIDDLTTQLNRQAVELKAKVQAQDAKLGQIQETVNRFAAQQIAFKQSIVDRIRSVPGLTPFFKGEHDLKRDESHQVLAIILHDATADDDSEPVLRNGRPDLPGPLAHWLVKSDGTIVLIAPESQHANHLGKARDGLTNANTIGVMVSGAPALTDDRQLESLIRLVINISERWGLPPDKIFSHAEVALPAGRKIDMAQQALLFGTWSEQQQRRPGHSVQEFRRGLG
jgi:hypothetical protein